jgi:YVTN family beta-propeller protein
MARAVRRSACEAAEPSHIVSYHTGTATPISIAANTAGKPVKAGQRSIAIAITPDGKTAYVANIGNFGNFGLGTVTPIATATNTAERPITVGAGPTAIAIVS